MLYRLLLFIVLVLTTGVVKGQNMQKYNYRQAKKQAKLFNKKVDNILQALENTNKNDSLQKYTLIKNGIQAALTCDSFDIIPNKRGEEKALFHDNNQTRLSPLLRQLVDGGIFFYYRNLMQQSKHYFNYFLTALQSSLFTNKSIWAKYNNDKALAAYYLSVIAYNTKEYDTAHIYADIALQNENTARASAEIKTLCIKQQMRTPEDSAKYVNILTSLHHADPKNQHYFGWLMEFYSDANHRNKLGSFASAEVKNNPQNFRAWALKGQAEMEEKQWYMATESFKKAYALDSLQAAFPYNIGVCLNLNAHEMADSLKNKKGRLSKRNWIKVKSVLSEAKLFLEKAKKLDPYRKQVDWVTPLYQVYFMLGDKANKEALEPIVNGFKGNGEFNYE